MSASRFVVVGACQRRQCLAVAVGEAVPVAAGVLFVAVVRAVLVAVAVGGILLLLLLLLLLLELFARLLLLFLELTCFLFTLLLASSALPGGDTRIRTVY